MLLFAELGASPPLLGRAAPRRSSGGVRSPPTHSIACCWDNLRVPPAARGPCAPPKRTPLPFDPEALTRPLPQRRPRLWVVGGGAQRHMRTRGWAAADFPRSRTAGAAGRPMAPAARRAHARDPRWAHCAGVASRGRRLHPPPTRTPQLTAPPRRAAMRGARRAPSTAAARPLRMHSQRLGGLASLDFAGTRRAARSTPLPRPHATAVATRARRSRLALGGGALLPPRASPACLPPPFEPATPTATRRALKCKPLFERYRC
ncbi:MAG: hypothetical protein J3K34DRAFT_409975 [Monoraphidium minutum]|nr:MAG: hypothetical protein J3K34DRAFT_409975 [Monoraphidium minutum]